MIVRFVGEFLVEADYEDVDPAELEDLVASDADSLKAKAYECLEGLFCDDDRIISLALPDVEIDAFEPHVEPHEW